MSNTLRSEVSNLDQHSAFTENEDGDPVLLLSEDATREVCLALDSYLDQLDPLADVNHDDLKQDDDSFGKQGGVALLHKKLMDTFMFERGTYAKLTPRDTYLLKQALEERSPDDFYTHEQVTETVATHAQIIQTES